MRRKEYRPLTEVQEDKMMALVEQGVLHKYIAERFNVLPPCVSNLIRRRKERQERQDAGM